MHSPQLTVVTVVHNGMPYLRETLQSLDRQTTGVAVLVVDDHSDDGTAECVSQFPAVTYVKNPRAKGIGSARRFSLDLVTTPYVSWLDADDYWDKRFAELALKALSQNSDAVMVSAGTVCVSRDGRSLPFFDSFQRKYRIPRSKRNISRVVDGEHFSDILVSMRPRWAWCAYVFRTSAVKAVGGFNPALRYAPDLDLIARLVARDKAVHIPENLTFYRRHPESLSQRLDVDLIYREKCHIVMRAAAIAGRLTPILEMRLRAVTGLKIFLMGVLRGRAVVKGLNTLRERLKSDLWAWFLKGHIRES